MANAIDTNVLGNLGLIKQPGVREANTELNEDAFLKLMIAQLENQDPMKPMENGEFLSQLAQMESVSGLSDLNKSVEKMATALQSNQALQASSLVGRWIVAPSNSAELWDEIGMAGSVDVPSNAGQVMVSIKSKAGELIKQIDLGEQQAGTVNFNWDGVGSNGEQYSPGQYKVEATARIGNEFEAIETNAIVPVDSVLMGKVGEPMTVSTSLLGNVKLSEVKQIM